MVLQRRSYIHLVYWAHTRYYFGQKYTLNKPKSPCPCGADNLKDHSYIMGPSFWKDKMRQDNIAGCPLTFLK